MQISLQIQDVKLMRKNLERLKNMGKKMRIIGHKRGELSLSVQGTSVKSTVHFPDLRVYEIGKAV